MGEKSRLLLNGLIEAGYRPDVENPAASEIVRMTNQKATDDKRVLNYDNFINESDELVNPFEALSQAVVNINGSQKIMESDRGAKDHYETLDEQYNKLEEDNMNAFGFDKAFEQEVARKDVTAGPSKDLSVGMQILQERLLDVYDKNRKMSTFQQDMRDYVLSGKMDEITFEEYVGERWEEFDELNLKNMVETGELASVASDAVPFVSAVARAKEMLDLVRASNAVRQGKATEYHKAVLKRYQDYNDLDRSFWYRRVQNLADGIAFMGEFWLSGPALRSVEQLSTKSALRALDYLTTRQGYGALTRGLSETGLAQIMGKTTRAYAQTLTSGLPRTIAEIQRLKLPQRFVFTEAERVQDGEISERLSGEAKELWDVQHADDGLGTWRATGRGTFNMFTEYLSELAGETLVSGGAVVGDAVKRKLKKTALLKWAGKKYNLPKSKLLKTVSKLKGAGRYTGVQGPVVETAEEYLGAIMRGERVPNKQETLEMLLDFTILQMPNQMLNSASRQINKHLENGDAGKAKKLAKDIYNIERELTKEGADPQVVLQKAIENNKNLMPVDEPFELDGQEYIVDEEGKLQLYAEAPKEMQEMEVTEDNKAEVFNELAKQQRGKPEEAMLKAKNILQAGPLGLALEYGGDLIHRMSWGVEQLEGRDAKVKQLLEMMTDEYGFEKESDEIMRSNYEYLKENDRTEYDTYEEYREAVKQASLEYAEEHKKLPTYNRAQKLANETAIAIGEWRFDDAIRSLREINKMIDEGTYTEEIKKIGQEEAPEEAPAEERAKVEPFKSTEDVKNTVVYHGTKAEAFDMFTTDYEDGLIHFSKDPRFASDWAYNKGEVDKSGELRKRANDLVKRIMENEGYDTKGLNEEFWRQLYDEDSYIGKKYGDIFQAIKEAPRREDLRVVAAELDVENTFNPDEAPNNIIDEILNTERMKSLEIDTKEELLKQGYLPWESKEIVDVLKKHGYDSMLLKEKSSYADEAGRTNVAVFSPDQVNIVDQDADVTDIMEYRDKIANAENIIDELAPEGASAQSNIPGVTAEKEHTATKAAAGGVSQLSLNIAEEYAESEQDLHEAVKAYTGISEMKPGSVGDPPFTGNLEDLYDAIEDPLGIRKSMRKQRTAEMKRSLEEKAQALYQFGNEYISFAPEMVGRLRSYDMGLSKHMHEYKPDIQNFSKVMKVVHDNNFKDFFILDLAMKNGNTEQINRMIFDNEFNDKTRTTIGRGKNKRTITARDVIMRWREIREEIYKFEESLGYRVNYTQEYFPRVVRDVDAYIEWIQDQIREKKGNEAEYQYVLNTLNNEKMRNKSLTNEQRAKIIDDALQGIMRKEHGRLFPENTSHAKAREVEYINEDSWKFYEDTATAINQYISSTLKMLHTRKFFGQLAPTDEGMQDVLNSNSAPFMDNIDQTIGYVVDKIMVDRGLSPYQRKRMELALKAVFNPKGKGKIVGAASTAAYIILLGPQTALKQIDDYTFTALETNSKYARKALWNTLRGRQKLSMEDIIPDFNVYASFFSRSGKMKKGMEWWMVHTGIRFMDNLQKTILIEANLLEAEDVIKDGTVHHSLNPKLDTEEVIERMRAIAGESFEDLKAAIENKDYKNELVQQYGYNVVADRHPVGSLDQPVARRLAGNAATFYDLQLFTLNMFRNWRAKAIREAVDAVEEGDAKKALKAGRNAATIVAFFSMLSGTADALISLIYNREIDPKEILLDGLISSLMSNPFYVKGYYSGPSEWLIKNITPAPLSVAGQIADDIYHNRWEKLLKYPPGVGKVYDSWWGYGSKHYDTLLDQVYWPHKKTPKGIESGEIESNEIETNSMIEEGRIEQ